MKLVFFGVAQFFLDLLSLYLIFFVFRHEVGIFNRDKLRNESLLSLRFACYFATQKLKFILLLLTIGRNGARGTI